jgi:hypothetical protein
MKACLMLSLLLSAPPSGDTAGQVVERALRAIGRSDVPGPIAYKIRGVGLVTRQGVAQRPTRFEIVDARDGRFRTEYQATVNGQQVGEVGGWDGKAPWLSRNGSPVHFTAAERAAADDRAYYKEVGMMYALSDEKRFRLELIPGAELDGAACPAVRVRSDGRPDVELYFDPMTHLPRKQVYDKLGTDGKRLRSVALGSEYKTFQGVNIPTKVETNVGGGADMTRLAVDAVEIVPVEKVEHLFKKPE